MYRVNVKEARKNISRLLDAVLAGEEVIITRRGRPVARLQGVDEHKAGPQQFPQRVEFRSRLPQADRSSAEEIHRIRDERG